jgi:hypothetical protein
MSKTYKTCIIVADRGNVFVAKSAAFDDHMHMLTAATVRVIRTWGTSKGLYQLIDGPLASTVLDATAPLVDIPFRAIIAIVPCDEGKWDKHLK